MGSARGRRVGAEVGVGVLELGEQLQESVAKRPAGAHAFGGVGRGERACCWDARRAGSGLRARRRGVAASHGAERKGGGRRAPTMLGTVSNPGTWARRDSVTWRMTAPKTRKPNA